MAMVSSLLTLKTHTYTQTCTSFHIDGTIAALQKHFMQKEKSDQLKVPQVSAQLL